MPMQNMMGGGMQEPEPVDGAPAETGLKAAGYTGPDERCLNCKNYDDEGGMCKAHGEAVDPEGHCPGFAQAGDEEESAAAGGLEEPEAFE